jgi:hypothetical protein
MDSTTDCEEPEPLISLSNLNKLRVKDLKKILSENGQSMSGKKDDMVLRCHMVFERKKAAKETPQISVDEQPLVTAVSNRRQSEDVTYEKLVSVAAGCVWEKDLRSLPSLNFVQLYDYLVLKTAKYDHSSIQTSGYKKLKAYQFFKEGHIKEMLVGSSGGISYVKSDVLASMKQVKYKTIISFNHHGEVLKAACMCPAG